MIKSDHNKNTSKPSIEKPWLKFYSHDALQLTVPTDTLYEKLLKNNHDYPDDIAILYQNIQITYRELFEQINRCAQALLTLGVKKNDIVTIGLISVPEVIYCIFALNKIGAIANLIHPFDSVENTCHYLTETDSRVYIMLTDFYGLMHKALKETPVLNAVVVSPVQSLSKFHRFLYRLKNIVRHVKPIDNAISWAQFIKQGTGTDLPSSVRADGDYAIISHTGGTTGTSKGVICTNKNILAVIQQSVVDRPHKRQECMMSVLPPFINYSLVNTMLEPLCCGLKTLLIPVFHPEKTADYISKYHVNHIISIPSYWKSFLKIPHIEKNDFSKLGFICSGGDYLEPSIEKEVNHLIKKCGGKSELMKGIGMTETTSVVASTYPWCNPENSVGIPCVMNNCKIIDTNSGEELGYGETGEICFAGPTVMASYYHLPSATNEIIHADESGTRWIHTGDIGYILEDGTIYIIGRIKRLIMQKDEHGIVSKVIPERIENIISRCSGVESCCVIATHHDQRIGSLKAFVVLDSGVSANEIVKKRIFKCCRESLPSYMVPQEIEFVIKLPQTARRKIDYRMLEEK